MSRLDGKVCVITGAGGGIGREAARLFSDEGARLCIADVDLAAAEATAKECVDAVAVQTDVSDADDVRGLYDAAAAAFGGIDVLYNNAGIMPADDASILDTEVDAWQRVQDVNTKG
ncbi:MAG TPA: SDR family NAD(P)-dependent oxidoreductase, partial [Egibacteraceae bacterium]|nr:SDR family NAD(P)-dependent oxidoreductase [Egibacteraceae bacterium]